MIRRWRSLVVEVDEGDVVGKRSGSVVRIGAQTRLERPALHADELRSGMGSKSQRLLVLDTVLVSAFVVAIRWRIGVTGQETFCYGGVVSRCPEQLRDRYRRRRKKNAGQLAWHGIGMKICGEVWAGATSDAAIGEHPNWQDPRAESARGAPHWLEVRGEGGIWGSDRPRGS